MRHAAIAVGLSALLHVVSALTQVPTTRLFFLDIRGGRIVSAASDGSDVRVLVSGRSGTPDGIAIDTDRGHIYWTIMGRPREDDGRIERVDLDGGNLTTIHVRTVSYVRPVHNRLRRSQGIQKSGNALRGVRSPSHKVVIRQTIPRLPDLAAPR